MILVAGATGMLGGEIIRRLRAQNKEVRALVRKTSDPAKVARLKELGATTVEGDLTDAASLASACRGIEIVITTVASTLSQTPGDTIPSVDLAGQLNLVDAAVQAQVSKYIYVSISGAIDHESPLMTAKRTVEHRVVNSGMSYTILRPTYFMEVWLSPIVGFDYLNSKATIYGEGRNPISWISLEDVAHFAVLAVDAPVAHNTILELGGPDKLTPNEVVKIFEKHTARPFHQEYVPVEALRAQRASATDPLHQSFAALMLAYAGGDPIDMEGTRQRFPVQLTSVQAFAERVMAIAA